MRTNKQTKRSPRCTILRNIIQFECTKTIPSIYLKLIRSRTSSICSAREFSLTNLMRWLSKYARKKGFLLSHFRSLFTERLGPFQLSACNSLNIAAPNGTKQFFIIQLPKLCLLWSGVCDIELCYVVIEIVFYCQGTGVFIYSMGQ